MTYFIKACLRTLLLGILFILLISQTVLLHAQSNPSDCMNAFPLCESTYRQSLTPTNGGRITNEIPTDCIKNGDTKGVFYRIRTLSAGFLKFTITPEDPAANLNWAVFDLGPADRTVNCSAILSQPELLISCNYAKDVGAAGETGALDGNVNTNQDENGTPYNAPISVEANRVYILYINTPDAFAVPYEIDLSNSTATYGDIVPPKVMPVFSDVKCQDTYIVFELNDYVRCSSLDLSDFEIITPDNQIVAIKSIQSPVCQNNPNLNFEKTIILELVRPISKTGEYTLRLKGEIVSACGVASEVIDKKFSITNLLIRADAGLDKNICQTDINGVVLNGSSDYTGNDILYLWSPATGLNDPSLKNPIAKPLKSQTYTLTVTAGDCISIPDQVRVNIVDFDGVQIIGAENACLGEKTGLVAVGADSYYWVELDVTASSVEVEVLPNTQLTLIPQIGNCVGDPIKYTLQPNLPPLAAFSVSVPELCQNQALTVQYQGPNTDALYTWDFDNAFIKSGTDLGPYEIYFTEPGLKVITLRAIANGCTTLTSRQLTVYSEPIVETGDDIWLCENDNGTTLNAKFTNANNGRFVWAPAEGLSATTVLQPFANPKRTITYTLFAIGDGGCRSEIDTIRVTVYPKLTASVLLNDFPVCFGSAGRQIQADISGGSGNYQYTWMPQTGLDNPFSALPFVNPKTNTTYTLYVNDENGCNADPVTVNVTVYPNPKANAGPDVYLCKNSVGVLLMGKGMVEPEGQFLYNWFPTTGLSNAFIQTPYAQPETTTVYTLTVTHVLSGCSSEVTAIDSEAVVIVYVADPPEANAGADHNICELDSVKIGGVSWGTFPDALYEWLPAEGLNNPNIPNPNASPKQSTQYQLRVVSLNALGQGCQDVDSVWIRVKARPLPITLQKAFDICPQDQIQIKGSNSNNDPLVTYQWLPIEGLSNATDPNPIAKPSQTTTYSLFTSFPGCGLIDVFDTVQVRITEEPDFEIPLPFTTLDSVRTWNICAGDTLQLGIISKVQPPYFVDWYPTPFFNDSNSLSPKVILNNSERLYVRMRKGNCIKIDSFEIKVSPSPQTKLITKDTVCARDTFELEALSLNKALFQESTFKWYVGDMSKPLEKDYKVILDTSKIRIALNSSKKIRLVVQTRGCTEVIDTFITVLESPQPKFRMQKPAHCDTNIYRFVNQTDSTTAKGDLYIWDFGDGSQILNEKEPTHVYAPGKYRISLKVVSATGCINETFGDDSLEVFPLGNSDFTYLPAPDTFYLDNTTVSFINKSTNVVTYFWDFGDSYTSVEPNPVHHYFTAGRFIVRLITVDAGGCRDTTQKIIIVKENGFKIPNIFSPNQDGINDFFDFTLNYGADYGNKDSVEVTILDRNGAKVFATTDITNYWNGKRNNSGEDCPEGVYFYQIIYKRKKITGYVTVVR